MSNKEQKFPKCPACKRVMCIVTSQKEEFIGCLYYCSKCDRFFGAELEDAEDRWEKHA